MHLSCPGRLRQSPARSLSGTLARAVLALLPFIRFFFFLEAARIRNPHKYSPGVVRKLLTAVLMKGPCSSAVSVSAQDVITPRMERGVLFKKEEVKVDFNRGEKIKACFLHSP